MMLFHNVRERRAAGSGAHPHRWVVDGRQREAAAHRRQGRKSNDGHRPAQGAAGRALMLCWHAAQQQAPSPREHAWLRRWNTPMPEALICPNRGLRDRARRPPASHALPSGRGHELRKGAHPEATQGACGAIPCVRAIGPFERRTARSRGVATHLSAVLAVGLVHNQREQPALTPQQCQHL